MPNFEIVDIAFLEDEEVKEAIRRGLKFDNKARDSLAGFGIGTSLAFGLARAEIVRETS